MFELVEKLTFKNSSIGNMERSAWTEELHITACISSASYTDTLHPKESHRDHKRTAHEAKEGTGLRWALGFAAEVDQAKL